MHNGLEEVENVLVDVCDECGNITSFPHQSISPIQQAMKRLVESGIASEVGKIPFNLKSTADSINVSESESMPNYQQDYPIRATG